MQIKWKEKESGAGGRIAVHGPEIDFEAEYDPEAIYNVNEPTAARLLSSESFEIVETDIPAPRKRKNAKNDQEETEVSEDKEKE